METLLIIALLASNVWLIRKVLTKPDSPNVGNDDTVVPPAPQAAEESPSEGVVGKSSFDADRFMDSFREIAREAAAEAAREVVPLIVRELGQPSDAGLPDTPEEKPSVQIPPDKLDEVFATHSVSELTGEAPLPAESNADGIGFEELQSAMKVLQDRPHTPDEEQTARRVISELEGTEIIEYVKLDPVVRKRILMIECQMPGIPEENETPPDKPAEMKPKKKIVFHADIDTTDIDAIDFNILH